jgi:multidrug resistance efflux pump
MRLQVLCAGVALAWASSAWAATFECLIQPNQVIDVRSRAEGLISKVYVQRGDAIKAGQVLVELESSAERSAVAAAKYRSEMGGRVRAAQERVQYASTKAMRTSELSKQHFVAAQARDDAQAEMLVAQAELVAGVCGERPVA